MTRIPWLLMAAMAAWLLTLAGCAGATGEPLYRQEQVADPENARFGLDCGVR